MLRRPDAAPRQAAAVSAAPPAHVVRHLMTQPMASPSCAAQQGNARSGGDQPVPCAVFFAVVECVDFENGIMLPINRGLNRPRTVPRHTILHPRHLIAPTGNGSRPPDALCKPHRRLRGTV